MSSEPMTLKNRFRNATRRLKRTLKSGVCMGARPIRNSNIGTESSQCGKFARFKDIVQDYRRDPNPAVAQLVRNLDGSRRLFEIVISRPYNPSNETQEQYIDRISKFIQQAHGQREMFQRDNVMIPDTYAQLKDELGYFIPFMFNYYIELFEELLPTGVINTHLNWEGRSMSSPSNVSRISYGSNNWLGSTGSTITNNASGSNESILTGKWYPKSAASQIPNWKGGKPPCPPGQTRNKTTKECRDKKGAREPCPNGETFNRKTKKCRRMMKRGPKRKATPSQNKPVINVSTPLSRAATPSPSLSSSLSSSSSVANNSPATARSFF